MCEQIAAKQVKTRKEHRCFGCLTKFPAGTSMSAETNVGDGHIYTIYICDGCKEFMSKYHEWCFDDLAGYYPEGCVADAKREMERHGDVANV